MSDSPSCWSTSPAAAPGRTDAGSHGSTGTLPAGWADIIDELERQPGDHLITAEELRMRLAPPLARTRHMRRR
jgi:hypothetical protein